MRRRLLLLAPFLLLAAPSVGGAQDMANEMHGPLPDTGGVDPMHDPRVTGITEHLGCLCGCGHRQVSECECGTAAHIRAEVAGMVSKGAGRDAIMAAMTNEYGDEILRELPMSGFNLVAWLGPFAVIGGVAVWLAFALKRWRNAPKPAAPAPSAPAASDPYLDRIERELRD